MSTFVRAPFVPTDAQQRLLYALKAENQHLFFRAETGTGKSFMTAMHALNLSRSMTTENQPTTTVIILVPTQDLAVQYHYWITNILGTSIQDPTKTAKIPKIVQTLFRTDTEGEQKQDQLLQDNPNPHVIISTPTRMLDMISQKADSFDIENLKCIILDEADDLVQPPEKTNGKKPRHPTPGEILLDWIFGKRNVSAKSEFMKLIAISATLTKQFEEFILEKGWLGTHRVDTRTLQSRNEPYATPHTADQHVLLVSLNKSSNPTLQPDRIRISAPRLPEVSLFHNVRTNPPRAEDIEPAKPTDYPPNYLSIPAMQRIIRETNTQKAIALIPHGASKPSFIWACQYFGLAGAQNFTFSLPAASEGVLEPVPAKGTGPTLYVAFPKEIRGLDFKRVDIVFILGEFGSVEDYVHITGRTGRRRNVGAVITILEETVENVGQKLVNLAVKLVRTGSRVGEWRLPTIEMDLKALPGDEFEEIRQKAGIVTVTEELRQKQERERRTREERQRWLLMEGVDQEQTEFADPVETDEIDTFGRPELFGMEKPKEIEQTMGVEETIELPPAKTETPADWRGALAKSLQSSGKAKESVDSKENRVIFGDPELAETIYQDPKEMSLTEKTDANNATVAEKTISLDEEEDADSIIPEPTSDNQEVNSKPLEPFPLRPPFPTKQYLAAWKDIMSFYKQSRSPDTQSTEILRPAYWILDNVTHSTGERQGVKTEQDNSIPPEALLPNEAVLKRHDVPILPLDINITTESGEDVLKHVMEGESLRQLEESHLLAPHKSRKPTSKAKQTKSGDTPGVTKRNRGRPRKNTPKVVGA